jgi:hypothetical protein
MVKMDYVEKSFASASETSKLLITLSTGVIAFCLTIVNVKAADKTLLAPATTLHTRTLELSLLLLLISAATGVWTQLAITHVLSEGTESAPASAWNKKIVVPFQLQLGSFLSGLIALTTFLLLRM